MRLFKIALIAATALNVQAALAARSAGVENTRSVGQTENCTSGAQNTLDKSKYVRTAEVQATVNGAPTQRNDQSPQKNIRDAKPAGS